MAQTETVTSTAPTVTSMLKMGLMLGVVIFMFIAFAWIMKRMTGLSPRGGDGMKVTGGLSLGQRERLVMVEVDNQRLLLGVTQQNITLIREMPAVTLASPALGAPGIDAIQMTTGPNGEETYSLKLQALAMMTILTLLPALLLMMTAFTRIVIVLSILRTAMGTAQTPSNQIVIGLALFLTLFVMQPVFGKIYDAAVEPYMNEEIGAETALQNAAIPLREFMFSQTRE
ncbi:unnamed protein product, partial [Cyprideis torosa]